MESLCHPRCKLCTNLFTLGKVHGFALFGGLACSFCFVLFFLSNNSLCRMAAVSAFILKLVDMSSDWSHLSDKCYCDCVLYPCSEWFLMIMPCLPCCFTLNYRCHDDRANCIGAQSPTPLVRCQCLHPSVPGIKNGKPRYAKHLCLKIMFCQLLNK